MCRKPLYTPQYFTLDEFLRSDTALSKRIENIPSWEIIEHLRELARFLDDIRIAWGSGIHISSGYRSKELNKAVGGVQNSVHQIGYAADIQPVNGDYDGFEAFLREYLVDRDYDQCLLERSGNVRWIHLSIFNNKGEQRKQMFGINV